MYLLVISLLLFSNCVLIQSRMFNLAQKLRSRQNNKNEGECACFPTAQIDKHLKDPNVERLVVFLYKNKNNNEIETFTPSPDIQKVIPNFRYGDRIRKGTTKTIDSLFHKPGDRINKSDLEDEQIGLFPGIVENIRVKPEFFEIEQDNPHKSCPFDSSEHGKLESSFEIGTEKDISFDKWFHQQIEALQNVDLIEHVNSINREVLRSQVQKTLVDNDMAINPSGIITDSSGVPINMDNLKLQPILIGDIPTGQQVLQGADKHIPYLEGVVITLADPPKVLNVIDLGKQYITNTSPAKNPETHMFGSIRHYEAGLKGLFTKPNQRPGQKESSSKRSKRLASSYYDPYYQYPQSSSVNHWHEPSSQKHSHYYYPSVNSQQSPHFHPDWESHSHWSPSWSTPSPYESIWLASSTGRQKRSASSYYQYPHYVRSENYWHEPSNGRYSHVNSHQSPHLHPDWQPHSHWPSSWDSRSYSPTPYENWFPSPFDRKKRSPVSPFDSHRPHSHSSSSGKYWHRRSSRPNIKSPKSLRPTSNWQYQPFVINPTLRDSHTHWSPFPLNPERGDNSDDISNLYPAPNINIWPAYQNFEIKLEPNILHLKDNADSNSNVENITHPATEPNLNDTTTSISVSDSEHTDSGSENTDSNSEHTDLDSELTHSDSEHSNPNSEHTDLVTEHTDSGSGHTSVDDKNNEIPTNPSKDPAPKPARDLPDIDTIKSVIKIFLDNMSQTLTKKDRNRVSNKVHNSTRKSGRHQIIEVPDFRIIGGSAATGSGAPISNKGRSGLIVK